MTDIASLSYSFTVAEIINESMKQRLDWNPRDCLCKDERQVEYAVLSLQRRDVGRIHWSVSTKKEGRSNTMDRLCKEERQVEYTRLSLQRRVAVR